MSVSGAAFRLLRQTGTFYNTPDRPVSKYPRSGEVFSDGIESHGGIGSSGPNILTTRPAGGRWMVDGESRSAEEC